VTRHVRSARTAPTDGGGRSPAHTAAHTPAAYCPLPNHFFHQEIAMNQYVIERTIPGLGQLTAGEVRAVAAKSNGVLQELGTDVQWLHSYATADKLFCVYRATSEDIVREHARRGGFPADTVLRVQRVIDPLSAQQ
jgi:hypothetical protein